MDVKTKLLLIAGIVLILSGTVMKLIDINPLVTMWFFITGGICKSIYLLNGIRTGQLAGRFYMGLLLSGLLLLVLSIFLHKEPAWSSMADIMLFTAISLKIFSIVGMKRTARIRKVSAEINDINATGCKY